ncbi:putative Gag polyprotein [Rosellinia necatrix]|uniref:Putative Gag polyprotein n=1 Tax=Rosellinia necatrix TaxID=77044 RepID=A0A1S7UMZ8_ROSNE|nr:putative Gag polyprotein [Rosellinia necatrix]
MSNLGPLPTDFTLSPNCAKDLNDIYKYFYNTQQGWYYLLHGPVEQTSCYPSGYAAKKTEYYSPARCPTGFTTACRRTNKAGTVVETVVTCCPTHSELMCLTTPGNEPQSTLGCTAAVVESITTTWTVSQELNGITSRTISTGAIGGVNAYGVEVRFQSTDFASSTTSESTSETDSTLVTPPSTPSNSPINNEKNSNDLSGGAIAGIVPGALVGILLTIGVIWKVRRNRPRQQVHINTVSDGTKKENIPQEAVELNAQRVVELNAQHIVELP